MKVIKFEEAKEIELQLLLEIARYCKENDIKYFLAYGTLIGAIRHKGFIPWDDDIDLQMPREDYNKFISTYNLENKNTRFRLIAPDDPISKHSFAKFIDTRTVKIESGIKYKNRTLGIDVDIFPIDGEPETEIDFHLWYQKLQKIYRLYGYYLINPIGNWKLRFGIPIIKFVIGGKKHLLKKAAKLHSLYPYEKSSFVGTVESAYNSPNNRYDKAWYESSVDVEFEGHMLKAPVGYDQILTKMYGDYMKLPPEDKQVTHHRNKTYWREEE